MLFSSIALYFSNFATLVSNSFFLVMIFFSILSLIRLFLIFYLFCFRQFEFWTRFFQLYHILLNLLKFLCYNYWIIFVGFLCQYKVLCHISSLFGLFLTSSPNCQNNNTENDTEKTGSNSISVQQKKTTQKSSQPIKWIMNNVKTRILPRSLFQKTCFSISLPYFSVGLILCLNTSARKRLLTSQPQQQ